MQLITLVNSLRELIYPTLCAGCRDDLGHGRLLCPACYAQISPIASRHFVLTARRTLVVHAVGSYQGMLAGLVKKKFNQQLAIPTLLGDLMYELLPAASLQADYLVPIPLHWTRYASRGFNQSVEMANRLSKHSGVPVLPLLKRRRRTEFQFRLSADERERNVASAFSLQPGFDIKNKKIILVDDLCTTGSTLIHAAKALLPLAPAEIKAVVVARALV